MVEWGDGAAAACAAAMSAMAGLLGGSRTSSANLSAFAAPVHSVSRPQYGVRFFACRRTGALGPPVAIESQARGPAARYRRELADGAGHALRRAQTAPREPDEVEPVAADGKLVAVLELGQLHPLAVAEYAVQAAVIEDAGSRVVAVDQRVTAGDRRVVEAKVGRQAAADARPAVLQRAHVHAVVGLEGEIVALCHERLTGRLEPVGLVGHYLPLLDRTRLEQRGAAKAVAPALGAGRELIELLERHGETA